MSFTDEEIARIAHAARRELDQVGDFTPALPWSSLPQDQRDVEVTLVRNARYGASPEVIHERRMAADPDLVPFDQLPPAERAYDYLFVGICAAMNEASDVKTRAENDQRALAEARALVNQQPGSNTNLPFSGAAPVAIEASARPPAQAPEA